MQTREEETGLDSTITFPEIHEEPGIRWSWCKLSRLMTAAKNVARNHGFDFDPYPKPGEPGYSEHEKYTPGELAYRFRYLADMSRNSDEAIFHYRPEFSALQSEIQVNAKEMDFETVPANAFVPAGWVKKVLDIIKHGGIEVLLIETRAYMIGNKCYPLIVRSANNHYRYFEYGHWPKSDDVQQ